MATIAWLAAPKFRNGILYPWVLNVGSLLSQKISGTSEKKVYHDPGSMTMTWQVQQGLSRFALPITFFASSHLEPSTHPTAKNVARATHHLYLPIPLGVTENINETVLLWTTGKHSQSSAPTALHFALMSARQSSVSTKIHPGSSGKCWCYRVSRLDPRGKATTDLTLPLPSAVTPTHSTYPLVFEG